MKWYKWTNIEDFESWHNQVKSFLELPKYGENSLTGEIDESNQMTIDYTEAVIESDGIYALADEEMIAQFESNCVISKKMPISKVTKLPSEVV